MHVSEQTITEFPGCAKEELQLQEKGLGQAPSHITCEDMTQAAIRRQVCSQTDINPCTAQVLAPYIS